VNPDKCCLAEDAVLCNDCIEFPEEECTIKVIFGWRRLHGPVNHKHLNRRKYDAEFAKKIYKDTKTAVMGVHAV
jgi:hypothetical protein